jgi:hypothetical protein
MSWNLRFELRWRPGGDVPLGIRQAAGRALKECFRKTKQLGLVVLEPTAVEPLVGTIQLLAHDDNEKVFALLVGQLRQFARAQPGLLVTVFDEYYFGGEDVLEVSEYSFVDAANGTGSFRSDSAPTDHVFRAKLPELNAREVARSFVQRMTAAGLLEWCGPPEGVIERVAALVEQVNKQRWRDATEVLGILETDPSVDEIHATDQQLDDLWRKAMNQY